MRYTVSIPARLVRAIRARGFDVEAFVVESLERSLELDPVEELETRMDVAKHMLRRAREELERGDPVQASEKLYKAVEECIKVLACLENLEECRRAREEGGWWSRLLSRAARRLAARFGTSLIREAWEEAFDLHVHGFHEHALGVDEVKQGVPVIEKLLAYTREKLKARTRHEKTPH